MGENSPYTRAAHLQYRESFADFSWHFPLSIRLRNSKADGVSPSRRAVINPYGLLVTKVVSYPAYPQAIVPASNTF